MTRRASIHNCCGDYRPLDLLRDESGRFARAECAVCGAHEDQRISEPLPTPSALKKQFAGWRFRTKATCLTCLKPPRKMPTKPEKAPFRINKHTTEKPAMSRTVAQLVTPANPQPTEAAKKAKRLVYQALEDYYDDVRKQYRTGNSDESVAKETGAAVEFVRSIREADFGPLGPPSELEALKIEVIQMGREVSEIHEKIERLYKRNGWAL